jgi:hypothetical protein
VGWTWNLSQIIEIFPDSLRHKKIYRISQGDFGRIIIVILGRIYAGFYI